MFHCMVITQCVPTNRPQKKYKFTTALYKGLMPSGRPAAYLLEIETKRKKRRDKGIKPKPPKSSHAKEKEAATAAKRRAKAAAAMKQMKKDGRRNGPLGPVSTGAGASVGAGAAATSAKVRVNGWIGSARATMLKTWWRSLPCGALG